MGNFISNHVGTTASQRFFLLFLLLQSFLDVALGFIYMMRYVEAEHRPHSLRSMVVANVVMGLCFIGIFLKTNGRRSIIQLWGVVGVLIAFTAWEPVAPVLTTLYTTDPSTNQPYPAGARVLASVKLAYRLVFLVLYVVAAVRVQRAYSRFHQVVKGYITKPSASIQFAWNVRFKFVSLMSVHAIQVIVCVVSLFYMLLPHADIGHASIIVVIAVKAVVTVSLLFGLVGAARESKWLMVGSILSLVSELVFFAYLVGSIVISNYALLTDNTAAAYVMIYGALSSLALSIVCIVLAIIYAIMTIKTFDFGLREWVIKEYDSAVSMATTNPFKE